MVSFRSYSALRYADFILLDNSTTTKLAQLVGSSADPLQFVCETACNAELDVELRLHAASVALPYLHPRLSAMATVSSKMPEGADPQVVLETVLGRIARLAPATIDAVPCSSEAA